MNAADFLKKHKKILIPAAAAVLLLVLWGYCLLFFQKGIYFEGAFLKREAVSGGYEYSGEAYGRAVKIALSGDIGAKGRAALSVSVGGLEEESFTVESSGEEDIGKRVKLYRKESEEEVAPLFDGYYLPAGDYLSLYDKNGGPVPVDIRVTVNGQSPFTAGYETDKAFVVRTAFGDNTEIRGNWAFFIMALLLAAFLAVDLRFPRLFFTLRHFLTVENPEPSDFFLTTQIISWILLPFVIAGLLIAGLAVPA